MLSRWMVLMFAVLMVGPVAAHATTVTVKGGDDPRFAWALSQSYEPIPPEVTVDPSGCPSHPQAGGCSMGTDVWIVRGPDDVASWAYSLFLHEVGHVVDYDLGGPSHTDPEWSSLCGTDASSLECFADVYGACATFGPDAPTAYVAQPGDWIATPEYSFTILRSDYVQACQTIDQLAVAGGLGAAPRTYAPPAPPAAAAKPVVKPQPKAKPRPKHKRRHKHCRAHRHLRHARCVR